MIPLYTIDLRPHTNPVEQARQDRSDLLAVWGWIVLLCSIAALAWF